MHKRERLKILLVSPYSSKKVGGIGTWTKNLIDYITESQRTVDLKFQNTAFIIKGNINNSRFKRVFWGIIDSLRIILIFLYNIVVFRPDAIHYTSSASIALFKDYIIALICFLFRVRFILHFRFGRIPELSRLNNWEWKWIKRVSRLADVVIVIDKTSWQVMKAVGGLCSICYIPNPVSKEIFDLAKSMNDFHGPRVEGKVVFAGHVVPAKGVFELVRACVLVVEVKQLVICGPYLEEVKEELIHIASARENGKWLVFKGEIVREDVVKELKNSFIFCLPSYTEGFPNAVMEAMAMSCAVVATGVGAVPEMLDWGTDKAGGIRIELKEVHSISIALKQLISDKDLAVRLGENGNRKILNEYNLDVVYPEYYKTWMP